MKTQQRPPWLPPRVDLLAAATEPTHLLAQIQRLQALVAELQRRG